VFQYCTEQGEVRPEANPNGAVQEIAGICNEARNVYGMMPHPERAASPVLGNTDGQIILKAMIGKI
jgi:phosphoribosylformylglycinamidine synthase